MADQLINKLVPIARQGQYVVTTRPVRHGGVILPAGCECVVEQCILLSTRYQYLLLHPSGLSVWAEDADLRC